MIAQLVCRLAVDNQVHLNRADGFGAIRGKLETIPLVKRRISSTAYKIMAPAYEYAVENKYQVCFYDPDDDRYNAGQAKYDMANDMPDIMENSPDNVIVR